VACVGGREEQLSEGRQRRVQLRRDTRRMHTFVGPAGRFACWPVRVLEPASTKTTPGYRPVWVVRKSGGDAKKPRAGRRDFQIVPSQGSVGVAPNDTVGFEVNLAGDYSVFPQWANRFLFLGCT